MKQHLQSVQVTFNDVIVVLEQNAANITTGNFNRFLKNTLAFYSAIQESARRQCEIHYNHDCNVNFLNEQFAELPTRDGIHNKCKNTNPSEVRTKPCMKPWSKLPTEVMICIFSVFVQTFMYWTMHSVHDCVHSIAHNSF